MELTEITGNLIDQQYQHSLFSDCAIQLHEVYYLGTCPFHQEAGHNTLHVSKKAPQWYCTSCGAGGTWYQYLERREGLSSEEILMRLIDAAGLSGERLPLRSLRHQSRIANLSGTAHLFYQSALQNYGGKSSMDFLQRAGYSQAEIKRIEVGHYPDRDGIISHMLQQGFSREMVNESGLTQQNEERPFRLTIPARDPAGNLIGFIYRRTGGEKPIYRFSHPVVRDQVFNLYDARGAKRVILGVKTAKEQVLKYASTLTDPEERERILILLHERFGIPESRLRKKLEILQKEERTTSYIISELRNDLQMPHEAVS